MSKNVNNHEEETLVQPSFIEKYGKQCAIGIAAVLVVVFGWMGYKSLIAEPKEAAANDAVPAAQKMQQDSISVASSLKAAQSVIDEYGGTDAGNLAHLYAGIALYNQGKYQEALDQFKDFDMCDDQNVSGTVYSAIANCQACLGQHSEAAQNFEKAAANTGNIDLTVMHLINAGEMYEFGVKDKAKALEVYQKANTYKAAYQVQNGQVEAYIQRASN